MEFTSAHPSVVSHLPFLFCTVSQADVEVKDPPTLSIGSQRVVREGSSISIEPHSRRLLGSQMDSRPAYSTALLVAH